MNRIAAILLLCLGNFYATVAQNPVDIDSLRASINVKSGLEKYDPMIELVRELAKSNYYDALDVAQDAYELAKAHGDTARIVQSGRICGQLFNYLNKSKEAIEILNMMIPLASSKYTEDYQKILNNLAIAHTARAEYDKALELHFKVLAINESDKDELSLAVTHSNIGFSYYRMRNFSEALVYFQKALELSEKSGDNVDRVRVLANLGFCYSQLGELELAKKYFEKSIKACDGKCNSEISLSATHGLGVVEFEMKNFDVARKIFQNAYQAAKKVNNRQFIAENLFWLSKLKMEDGELDVAVKDLIAVEALALEQGYTELLISIYKQLSGVYEKKEDYKNYSAYLEKYVALKDSIYDEHVLNNLAKAKADYDQRENLAIIKAKEMTIAQQHRFNIAVVIIAFLAGALGVVLFYNNNAIKKVNVELMRAKDLIFDQNKALTMRNRELDRVVEKKTDELKMVNLSLKEMNDELNTFIYRTAQDIRGPLATLKGMCYVALKDIKDDSSLLYLDKINDTADHLQSILKRLLIINSINSTKVNPTVIDLRKLVDNVISSQQQKGLPKNLLFRRNISENVIIQCDQELLSIVLENSIENAVKFCNNSAGAEHFVEVNVAPGKNNRMSIRVTHNGIVTSEYNTDDIYEVFLDSMFAEPSDNLRQDLYFVKTAAKKIGARVEFKKTSEGYNELSVVF